MKYYTEPISLLQSDDVKEEFLDALEKMFGSIKKASDFCRNWLCWF